MKRTPADSAGTNPPAAAFVAAPAELLKGRANSDADAAEAFAGVDGYARVPGVFFGDPSELLGRVIQVTRNSPNDTCPAQTEKPVGLFTDYALYGFAVRHDAEADVLKQVLITKNQAGKLEILKVFAANMEDKDLYDLEIRHRYANVSVDGTWVQARKIFKEGYGADLYSDDLICWLYAVQAASEIQTIGTKYHETTAGAAAGAWGLNVEGKLYSSDRRLDKSRTFWVFATAIKRPGKPATTTRGKLGQSFYRPSVRLAFAETVVAQADAGTGAQTKEVALQRIEGDVPPVNNRRILTEMENAKIVEGQGTRASFDPRTSRAQTIEVGSKHKRSKEQKAGDTEKSVKETKSQATKAH